MSFDPNMPVKLPFPSAHGLLCFCAGLFCVGAMAPFNLWPLMAAGIGLFYVQLSSCTTLRRALVAGWLFGFGYFAGGLWWIANALLVDGNPFLWVWPLAFAGLPAALAFFPAFAAAFIVRFSDLRSLRGLCLFISSMAGSEWLRGHILTGFPWNLYGYAWGGWEAMMQTDALGGPYLLTLLSVFWCALPGFVCVARGRRLQIAVAGAIAFISFSFCAAWGYGRLNLQTQNNPDSVWIRVIQPNIAQADKWDSAKAWENLRKHIDMTVARPQEGQRRTTIIVWPETSLSFKALEYEAIRNAIRSALLSYNGDAWLLAGFLRRDESDNYYNSLVALDKNLTEVAVYDKAHLVPFGEYLPFQDILPLKPFVQLSGFRSGEGEKTIALPGIPAFSPLVCYEIIFPESPGENASFIVNVTNDGWYGDSPGPRQHFMQARFRAIEQGIPVIRSANTGVSGLIDPLGRVLYQAEINERRVADLPLPTALTKKPPYTRAGDIPFASLWAILLAIGLFPMRRPR